MSSATVKTSPSVMSPIVTVEPLTLTVKPSVVVVAVITVLSSSVIVTCSACAKVTVPFVSVEAEEVASGTASVIDSVAV